MQEVSRWEKIKQHIVSHKLIYTIGTAAFFITLLISLFVTSGNQSSKPQTAGKTASTSSQNASVENNVLVGNDDVKRVQDAYAKKYKQAGKQLPATDTHFNYNVDSSLSEKKGSLLPFVKSVFASGCNLVGAPSTVTGYLLKDHYTSDEAASIAKEYKMDTSIASSVPAVDGVSFDYYFSDPKTSAYFKLTEPSGTYQFHTGALSANAAIISQSAAQAVAMSELGKHKLSDNLSLINATETSLDPTYHGYLFSYFRKLEYVVTDAEAVKELGTSTSVCNVSAAKTMNYIDVLISDKGNVGKIENQLRTITNTASMPRESIDDAIKEYKDHLPTPPIVIGSDKSGTVSLDEAVLTYYDLGDTFGQYAYVPVYVTSGKTASGTRVFTIFPAVSEAELEKTPLAPSTKQSQSLQLDTFNPPLPKPSGKLCFGNMVDYTITCTQNTTPVCNGFVSLPSDKNDPFGVCAKGCQTKSDVFHVDAGQDACAKFLERQGLPSGYGANNGINKSTNPKNSSGGDVSCTLGGCPC